MIPYYFAIVRHPTKSQWMQLIYSSGAETHDPSKTELVQISLDSFLERHPDYVLIVPQSGENHHNVGPTVDEGSLFEFLTKKGWQYTLECGILKGRKELIFG